MYFAVCVKECPAGPDILTTELDFIANEEYKTDTTIKATYNSTAFMGYCIPQVVETFKFADQLFEQMNGNSGIANFFVEIKESW